MELKKYGFEKTAFEVPIHAASSLIIIISDIMGMHAQMKAAHAYVNYAYASYEPAYAKRDLMAFLVNFLFFLHFLVAHYLKITLLKTVCKILFRR